MRAMILRSLAPHGGVGDPLEDVEWPDPVAGEGEIVLRVSACGVCHTELDEIDGRAPPPSLPVILGHQVVGRVESIGPGASGFKEGDRAGAAWIFSACGVCQHCRADDENLCPRFRATGRDAHGGYAERMAIPAAFAVPIPERFDDVGAAPLLCAGAIGYRSLRLAGHRKGGRIGLTGFGASAHLVLLLVKATDPGAEVFVFARDPAQRAFALTLGAAWAGDTLHEPPAPLDAVIDTTPAWTPVLGALRSLAPGGRLVINALRKEPGDREALLGLDYPIHLWMEKEVKTVANVTRNDVRELLDLAASADLRPETRVFPLAGANQALAELRRGGTRGALVLRT